MQAVGVAHHRGVAAHRPLQVVASQRAAIGRLGRRCVCPAVEPRVLGGGPSGPTADDQSFQQAVGGQPVGAVHSGAGHLASGEQPRQLGAPVDVGDHAAAAVVRTGSHRDRLANGIDAGCLTRSGDGRESAREVVDAAGVEEDAFVAEHPQPGVDGAGHHVAGRQVAHRVHACGHRIALTVNQSRALAANRLGDQRPAAAGAAVVQHRRVELDELDVAHRGTGPQRQRDAVAGGALGVGGRAVQLPEATGGQDHRRCVHDADAPPIRHQHTGYRIGARRGVVQQAQRDMFDPDVQRGCGMVEGALHLGAGGIAAGMHDTPPRVPAFTAERPAAGRGFVELRSVAN
jgi:hypothetical protein